MLGLVAALQSAEEAGPVQQGATTEASNDWCPRQVGRSSIRHFAELCDQLQNVSETFLSPGVVGCTEEAVVIDLFGPPQSRVGRLVSGAEGAGSWCRIHPSMGEHLVEGRARRWIRLKHASDEVPTVCQCTQQTKFQDAGR
jgi:hypothetical protein